MVHFVVDLSEDSKVLRCYRVTVGPLPIWKRNESVLFFSVKSSLKGVCVGFWHAMPYCRFFSSLLFTLLFRLSVAAVAEPVPLVRSTTLYDSAIGLLLHQEYQAAGRVLHNHIRLHPTDNRARYLAFAVEQTRILDYESYALEHDSFQCMADSLKSYYEGCIGSLRGVDSTRCLFYLANVCGGIGVMQAKTGNWFDAVKNAITSASMLKQVKRRDPFFLAADLGLGIFDYYLSTSFKWLPFSENRIIEGIGSIERALSAALPYNYAAKNTLCWIHIERKEFKQADSLAQSVLNEIPDNTIFLRIKALVALWTGHYKTAFTCGSRFAKITEARQPPNWSDLVTANMIVVLSLNELDRTVEALAAADNMMKNNIPQTYRKMSHVKKNIKSINDFRRKYHYYEK